MLSKPVSGLAGRNCLPGILSGCDDAILLMTPFNVEKVFFLSPQ